MSDKPLPVKFRDTVAPPVARIFIRLRFTPIVLTLIALLCGLGAAVPLAMGRFGPAFFLLLASVLLDILDGVMARELGTSSPAGAFLDSVLDRYVDTAVFLGLAWYFMTTGQDMMIVVSFAALIGATVTSYTAARAGSLGVHYRVGWMLGRLPRAILMLIAIGFPVTLVPVLWILAILGNYSAVLRCVVYYRKLRVSPNAADKETH